MFIRVAVRDGPLPFRKSILKNLDNLCFGRGPL